MIQISSTHRYSRMTALLAFGVMMLCLPGLYGQSALTEGYRAAWAGEYEKALLAFQRVLANDPGNQEALAGRSWTYAWKGDYQQAEHSFRQLMEQPPGNPEAEKGLAYVALWSGDRKTAKATFNRLIISRPEEEPEWRHALSQLYLQQGEHVKARGQLDFLPVTKVDPTVKAAIQSSPASFEASLWGGYSHLGESNRFGIRALQVNWNPAPTRQVWVRMDNSLTLDHRTLFSRDTGALAFFAGGKFSPHQSVTVAAEVGNRYLPDIMDNQQILSVEPTWFVTRKLGWKNGLIYVRNPGLAGQKLAYTGLVMEVMPSVWLEPQTFFLWESPAAPRQWRTNLNLKYRKATTGQEFNIGATFAPEMNNSDPTLGATMGGWIQYQHPMGQKHWIFTLARIERNNLETLTNLALGMRFRLEQ